MEKWVLFTWAQIHKEIYSPLLEVRAWKIFFSTYAFISGRIRTPYTYMWMSKTDGEGEVAGPKGETGLRPRVAELTELGSFI